MAPIKLPRNARPGIKLPKIGGLKIRRNVKTGKYGLRDAIVGPDGKVYGFTDPNKYQIGAGTNAGYHSIVKKGAKPGTPGSTGTGTPAPPPDEYAGYDKEYPWVGKYLRSLRGEEESFNKTWEKTVLPGVSAGLKGIADVGAGLADRYSGMTEASKAAYGAAAGISPLEVAGAQGVADPSAIAAARAGFQSAASTTGTEGNYRAALLGLGNVTATQGMLGGLAAQAMTISKSYSEKRISERFKIDQWIAEQKSAAEERLVRTQYNMAQLGIRTAGLEIQQGQLDLATTTAGNVGKKTDNEFALDGNMRRVPRGAGPKSLAIINRTRVTSKDGNDWYSVKGGGGGGGGSNPPTASQINKFSSELRASYEGGRLDTEGNLIAGEIGTGIRDSLNLNQQAAAIAAKIRTAVKTGFMKMTRAEVETLLRAAIPNVVVKQDDEFYAPTKAGREKGYTGVTYDNARTALRNLVWKSLGI